MIHMKIYSYVIMSLISLFFGLYIVSGAAWGANFDDNLAIYYKMDEVSDNMTNVANVTVMNITNFVGATRGDIGLINGSVDVTGAGNYIETDINGSLTDGTSILNNSNGTISFWVNVTSFTGTQSAVLGLYNGTDSSSTFWVDFDSRGGQDVIRFHMDLNGSIQWELKTQDKLLGNNDMIGVWTHIVLVHNGTGPNIYINGTAANQSFETINNQSFWFDNLTTLGQTNALSFGVFRAGGQTTLPSNVKIEEVGFWNRVLSDAEISDLYNDGEGITKPLGAIDIELTLPPNDFASINTSETFNATLNASNLNLVNATLYLWHSNGSLYNDSLSNVVTGSENNATSFDFVNLTIDTFSWNVFGCGNDTAEGVIICNFATDNFTYEVSTFIEEANNFSNTTFVLDTSTFRINITVGDGRFSDVTATLNYNGTRFSSTRTGSGSSFEFIRQIDIPNTNSRINMSVIWEIATTELGLEFFANSTQLNQTVLPITFDNCTTETTLILNYTVKDEETITQLNATLSNVTVDIEATLSNILDPTETIVHNQISESS